MNITLFGSAFNPPHLGHAFVIQDFLEVDHCDELWLLPTNISSFGKELLPAETRLEMCNLFIEDLPTALQSKIKICPIEIDLNLNGETYLTLQTLKSQSEYLKDTMNLSESQLQYVEFSFLMGSDQLPNFHKWTNWQELLDEMTFYVYPRVGYPLEPLKPGMKPFTHDHQIVTNISSTIIKKRKRDKKEYQITVTTRVANYIKDKNLYCL